MINNESINFIDYWSGTRGFQIYLFKKIFQISNFMKENNKSTEYRVGLKSLADLYPSRIREKIAADNKQKTWDAAHKKITSAVTKQIEELDLKNSNNQNLGLKEKLEKEDLDATLEFLNGYEKKYSDIKTSYDCVVFESNDGWVAVIDTTETVSRFGSSSTPAVRNLH